MADEKSTPEMETQIVPPGAQLPNAQVRDKRVVPEGVVPKQAQGYVVAGLAVLILMAVMFSKNHAKPAQNDVPPTTLTVSNDMNQRKIQELEQELSADQRQSEQQAQMRKAGAIASPGNPVGTVNPAQAGDAAAGAQMPSATEPPRDPIADAEKALAFKARFASNLVSAAATGNKRAPEVNVNSAHGQPYVLFEGTTIDTALVNRLDGEFVGSVKVMVTNPVYSQDRQHVLIPEGTFILGDAQKVSGFGQKRLAAVFHRMLMPDGYSVDLDQFHGLDQAGETGLKDKINNHYLQIFGISIALGIIGVPDLLYQRDC